MTHIEWSISGVTQCDFYVDDHTQVPRCHMTSHGTEGFWGKLGVLLTVAHTQFIQPLSASPTVKTQIFSTVPLAKELD